VLKIKMIVMTTLLCLGMAAIFNNAYASDETNWVCNVKSGSGEPVYFTVGKSIFGGMYIEGTFNTCNGGGDLYKLRASQADIDKGEQEAQDEHDAGKIYLYSNYKFGIPPDTKRFAFSASVLDPSAKSVQLLIDEGWGGKVSEYELDNMICTPMKAGAEIPPVATQNVCI
jgi:hypothetical protein